MPLLKCYITVAFFKKRKIPTYFQKLRIIWWILMGRNRPLHHQLKYAVMQSYRHRGQRRQFKQQWQELDKAYERGDITFEEWLKEKSKIGL